MRETVRKTSGMKIVEKYRPRMSRLSEVERQRLLDRAMQIAYGSESKPAPIRRGGGSAPH